MKIFISRILSHWHLWLSQQLSFLLMSPMTVSYKLQLSEVGGFSLYLETRAVGVHILANLVSTLLLFMLVWVSMKIFFPPSHQCKSLSDEFCSSVGNKCSIPSQLKLFYLISSDKQMAAACGTTLSPSGFRCDTYPLVLMLWQPSGVWRLWRAKQVGVRKAVSWSTVTAALPQCAASYSATTLCCR